ncbi:RepB family protein [Acetobacterium wieringae]|uniref:RepB family protein n=1 Tax=Acetobacterium wieringae TaxID=52694 RepID=UPI0031595F83
MSSKIGRPVIGKAKTNDVKVRLDDDMHEKLVNYCKEKGITKAEAIRQSIELFLSKKK